MVQLKQFESDFQSFLQSNSYPCSKYEAAIGLFITDLI